MKKATLMKAGHTAVLTCTDMHVTVNVKRPDGTGVSSTWPSSEAHFAWARSVSGLVADGWLIS
jgi:hypothetical protein